MRRSDRQDESPRYRLLKRLIIVAWVAWWGTLYGKMVVEQRGSKLQAWIAQVTRSRSQSDPGPAATREGGAGFSIVKRSTSRPAPSQAR
jgi:hypothetical protein